MKKALICGVTGQDGSYLAKFLLDKGYVVYGTSRDSQMSNISNLQSLGINGSVQLLSMALNDFRSVLQTLAKVEPDEVYNLAGPSSVSLSFQQPVETLESITVGTLNLLESIRFINLPVWVYNACSSECFGTTEGFAADETTAFRPRSPYALAKAAAFWEVSNYREAYNLYACSGLLFNHESPFRSKRFVTRKIISAACRIAAGSNEKLSLGNFAICRDWGWAPEYVAAMWLMLQQPKADDYVIATGKSHSLEEFVAETFNSVGLDWHDYVLFDESLLRPSDIAVSRANPAKAKAILGWEATFGMQDVVRMMLEAEKRMMVVD